MSVATVAGKEFADARRSRALWALSGLFVLLTLLLVWTYTVVVEAGDAELTGLGLLGFVGSSVSLFVSIAALVVCY
jgi:ABC-2 type transport system permease protein